LLLNFEYSTNINKNLLKNNKNLFFINFILEIAKQKREPFEFPY